MCLKNRSIAQIRTHLHELKKKLMISKNSSSFQINKNSIPQIIYKIFKNQIEEKKEPTSDDCIKAYDLSPTLRKYSPQDLTKLVKKAIQYDEFNIN